MTRVAKVEAVPVPTAFDGRGAWEIVRIDYAPHQLTVVAQDAKRETSICARFDGVVAYRVMDERDLGEYWPACSLPDVWVFLIQSGGWLAQELVRPDSCIGLFYGDVREYLVAGCTDCVSVLCTGALRVELECGNS
ncbi:MULTISPECIES: hypothetical protein [unclassified Variovorax]|jgi:hypothetical protein|uniref:hypothetical protein n=1 Tax=unclassified Variovorax TaxID=663243 RepID=UPI000F7DE103|nr:MULTISPECIES: hypothetical protein [unclassified Variovorax]RSZ31884.1 hypothetical protein EJO70_30805 [Variovorax sp. 553]RSZ32150.1 hypothetical protein EJO71_30805 [Variovorax sp. 679]